ncbi:hypothetical protein Airi01_040400 [Actinoallomurus iriomotensis]|uniref:Uncharacterized protein n=1 Tax=Actinoallomurus iriomotensis TaxID=478107 RepID=A0A9W6VKX2_9ACTN|nr:hypothetical protein Airi01_040400 [Actinoallomurus iriomotensis]
MLTTTCVPARCPATHGDRPIEGSSSISGAGRHIVPRDGTQADATMAVAAAKAAAPGRRDLSFDDRVAVFLWAADPLGPSRP